MNFAFYMLMPTIPVYLVEELGINTSHVGIALASYTLGLMLVRPFSGYLVDCFSRKPLYFLAFLAFAFMFAGYLFATSVLLVMLVRFIQGGFMGLTSVAGNTIAIDVIPSERRGEGMGFYGLTINLAMSLSPLVAVMAYNKSGFHPVVIAGMCIAFVGVFSVSLIHYPRRKPVSRPPLSLDRFILVKALWAGLSYMFYAISYGMVLSFAILYGKEIAIEDPAYFFIFMAFGVGSARLLSGKLIDRGRIHTVSILSLISLIISFAVFSSVHTETAFFVCALVIGIGFGTSVPAFQMLFVNVAPHNMRGTATSTYLTSFDLGVGIGTLSAGFISSRFNLSTAYLVAALACFLSLTVYLLLAKPAYERDKLTSNPN